MLGRYVSTYFNRKGDNVIECNRSEIDTSDFDQYEKAVALMKKADVVINCIGTIRPVVHSQDKAKTFMVNAVWPNYLARQAYLLGVPYYHVTTDCVFSGKHGIYDEMSFHDMFDAYGFSKSLGDYSEQYGMVIRTSIIGEEQENFRSLIEWVKSKANQEVDGYTNHIWNGVTCLQLAKVLDYFISNDFQDNGIFHLHSEAVTKAELVQMISDAFNLNLKINPIETSDSINRTLTTITKMEIEIPSLKDQIQELVGYFNE